MWFSPGTSVSLANKINRHYMTEILLTIVVKYHSLNPTGNELHPIFPQDVTFDKFVSYNEHNIRRLSRRSIVSKSISYIHPTKQHKRCHVNTSMTIRAR